VLGTQRKERRGGQTKRVERTHERDEIERVWLFVLLSRHPCSAHGLVFSTALYPFPSRQSQSREGVRVRTDRVQIGSHQTRCPSPQSAVSMGKVGYVCVWMCGARLFSSPPPLGVTDRCQKKRR